MFAKEFKDKGAKRCPAVKFECKKAIKGVTSKVQIKEIGNAILIDTPGTGDTSRQMSDEKVMADIIEKISPYLKNEHLGISTFVHCILPDESNRIRENSVDAMSRMLLSLTSLYQ